MPSQTNVLHPIGIGNGEIPGISTIPKHSTFTEQVKLEPFKKSYGRKKSISQMFVVTNLRGQGGQGLL